jgi:hypothetical protein
MASQSASKHAKHAPGPKGEANMVPAVMHTQDLTIDELLPSVKDKYPLQFKDTTGHVICSGDATFPEFMTKASMAASKDKKTIVSKVDTRMLVFQVGPCVSVDGGRRFIVVSWLTNPPIIYYPYVKVQAPESKLPVRNIGIRGALQELVEAMSAMPWNANVHSSKNIIEISGPNGEMCTLRLHRGARTHDQPRVYCRTTRTYTHLVLDAGGKVESMIDLTHPRFAPADKKCYNNGDMKRGGHFWDEQYDSSWYNYSPIGGALMGDIFTFCSTHLDSPTKKRKAEKDAEGSEERKKNPAAPANHIKKTK